MGRGLLFRNGTVLTADVARPVARAVAVEDGVIVALDDEALDYGSRGASEFDLAGGCLVPGFRDGHAHPLWGGIELGQVPLVGARTDGRGRRARAERTRTPIPSSSGSRAAATTRPSCRRVSATRRCSTLRSRTGPWCSRRATITRCGSTPRRSDTRESTRARPTRSSDGSSGTATARRSAPSSSGARSPWSRAAARPRAERARSGSRTAMAALARSGITWVQEAASRPSEARVYAALARRGELTTRTNVAFRAEPGRWSGDRVAVRRVPRGARRRRGSA